MLIINNEEYNFLLLCKKALYAHHEIKDICPNCCQSLILENSICDNCGYNLNNIKMQEYNIWEEGYAASGDYSLHQLLGKAKGRTFREAVNTWVSTKTKELGGIKKFIEHYGEFDTIRLTLWGCRLYPTEEEAAKSFG